MKRRLKSYKTEFELKTSLIAVFTYKLHIEYIENLFYLYLK